MTWIVLACFPLVLAGAGGDTPDPHGRFGLVHGEPEFIVELGVTWNRHDFTWSGIEREKGVFDFGEYPARVDKSNTLGVKLLPILDYNPAWDPDVSPADDETLDYWVRYVQRTVAEFKGRLTHYQVWNEPNYGFWKPDKNPRDYAELLRRSYLAAKAVDPTAQIIGVNCSGIDLDFTEKVFRYGGLQYCDILAYQPYRIAPEVGQFEEMAALRKLVSRYGEQKPIWFTEMGWGSHHFPFKDSEDFHAERPGRRLAAFLVRYMTIIQATGVDKVFWFSQASEGSGLMTYPKHEKRRVFYAYQHFLDAVADYDELREVIPHDRFGVYAYLFRCPEEDVLVAWSVCGPQVAADIKDIDKAREARDILGESIPVPGNARVELSGEPMYFFFDKAPADLLGQTALQVSPSRIELAPGESKEVTLRWQPAGEAAPECTVAIHPAHGVRARPRKLTLTPGEEASFTLTARKGAEVSRGTCVLECSQAETSAFEVDVTPRRQWLYQSDPETCYLTPSLLTDTDGSQSLLVAAYNAPELICLSPSGDLRWKYEAGSEIYHSVAVGDIQGDDRPEIVAAMPRLHKIIALSADGVLLWRAKLEGEPFEDGPSWHWTRPQLADLDDDGLDEILYADYHGQVTALSGAGDTLWCKKVSEHRCDRPVFVGDILGDGREEILVGDFEGTLRCLSADGEVLWTADAGSNIIAAPVAIRMQLDEPPLVLAGTHDEKAACFSNKGLPLWTTDVDGTMDLGSGFVPRPVMGRDTAGEAVPLIIASTRNHEVLALDRGGNIVWRAEVGAQIRSIPAVGDINGDGVEEILFGAADWRLHGLDANGDEWIKVDVGARVDAAPLLTDLDGDGLNDVVLPVRGGRVMAFSAGRQ